MWKFIEKQEKYYHIAYKEIQEGKKRNHWIWFIFPQIKGLGSSDITKYYEIESLDEEKAYLHNEYLRNNLINILKALLFHCGKKISDIMDKIDAVKLLSSMTLFMIADEYNICNNIFLNVIKIFYNGKLDYNTLEILKKQNPLEFGGHCGSCFFQGQSDNLGHYQITD